ncbi:MAG TPA: hypothetical protein VFJ57_05630 [Solirubrobacterales bacterium]|nr:hypothetical protein [Solirubrobacterales bacterium]
MTVRRATIVVCALCAFAFSAIAAQSALGVTKGTTAFTCKKVGIGGTFTKPHCRTTDVGAGEYAHLPVPEGTTTEITGTNAKTVGETLETAPWKLKTVVAGVEVELQAANVSALGWAENAKDPSGEHYIRGTGMIVFNGVTVTKPAGNNCVAYTDEAGVKGKAGRIDTRALKATTTEQGDFVKFEAAEGEVLANFFVECAVPLPAIEGTWGVTGSVKGAPNGATINFTHPETTAPNTLKAKGAKAGIEGSLTVSGKDGLAGDTEFTPLSATTVETQEGV